MNPDTAACPRCGAPIPAEAPRGLCPRCLMDGALATEPKPPSSPAPSVEELADVFPQLEVFELLGSGGMGRVYKARQTHLDRIVALKILPPELAKDLAFAERFAREARALAKLNHPNIVQCYDFGQSKPKHPEDQSYFYLLLEFVDGVNLRQSMHTGALTSREALGIVPRLCDALNYAHEQGVLHRDIKPENILIDKQGRVKIADFGLARFQSNEDEDDTNAMTLTMSGAQLGTAAYMAPEQIEQPHQVDHRADIYSLGVVFYEMLTGELPLGRFAAPSETSGVDPRLDSVVFRTLEKQKERRYQSAGEVQSQVETIAGTPTPNQAAAFSTAAKEEHPDALETSAALAFPPSWMTLWNWIWRQPFLFQRGQLTLEAHQLVYQSPKATLTIPLDAIESISLAPLSFAREPLGRCPLSVCWRDAAGRVQTTCFLLGSASWPTPLSNLQELTDVWVQALCRATVERQGLRPEIDPEKQPTSADVTPDSPNLPVFIPLACVLFGISAVSMTFSGAPLIGIPLGFAVAAVAFGVWRRRQGSPVLSESAPGSSPTQPTAPPSAPNTPPGPSAPVKSAPATAPAKPAPTPPSPPQPPLSEPAPNDDASPSPPPTTEPLPKRVWHGTRAAAGKQWEAHKARKKTAVASQDGSDANTVPTPPRYSKMAIWAFGFATVGWALLMIGPVIGFVLGWIALNRIHRAKVEGTPLNGRGMALFAALQAPIILVVGALGASAFALWETDLMPVPFTIGILTLSVLVFLGVRALFRMAGLQGLWSWRKKAGAAPLIIGVIALTATTWALEDLQNEWPLAGMRATTYFVDANSHGDPGSGRALIAAIGEGPFGDMVHARRSGRRSQSVKVSVVTQNFDDGIRILERAEADLAQAYPGLRMNMPPRLESGWNPDGRKGDELFVTFSVIGCFAGLCFAVSGFGSGGLGLLFALGASITLFQLQFPSPFGYPVLNPEHVLHLERPLDNLSFPSHIDGIRIQ